MFAATLSLISCHLFTIAIYNTLDFYKTIVFSVPVVTLLNGLYYLSARCKQCCEWKMWFKFDIQFYSFFTYCTYRCNIVNNDGDLFNTLKNLKGPCG